MFLGASGDGGHFDVFDVSRLSEVEDLSGSYIRSYGVRLDQNILSLSCSLGSNFLGLLAPFYFTNTRPGLVSATGGDGGLLVQDQERLSGRSGTVTL